MIEASELDEWARRFGVSAVQVGRDHFISHVLHAIGEMHPDARFFGGTALCRTLLEGTRLSEDIDLLHPEPHEFLTRLRDELPRAMRREFPDASWTAISTEGDGLASALGAPDVTAIKIYVGRDGSNTRAWEFVPTRVHLRYSDLPAHQVLGCPNAATFAAMKLAAWSDRHTPRDLFDLAGLAACGALGDQNVGRLFEAKMGVPIIVAEFAQVPAPTAAAWHTELAAQVGVLPAAEECLERVRAALGVAGDPPAG